MIYEGESLLFKVDGSVSVVVYTRRNQQPNNVSSGQKHPDQCLHFSLILFFMHILCMFRCKFCSILKHDMHYFYKICLIAAISFWTIFKSLVWITGITHFIASGHLYCNK